VLAAYLRGVDECVRLGRLNDETYGSWETFVRAAGKKIGIEILASLVDSSRDNRWGAAAAPRGGDIITAKGTIESKGVENQIVWMSQQERVQLERRLEVLHVLRCILGPVVESWIVLDRTKWVNEELTKLGTSDPEAGNRKDFGSNKEAKRWEGMRVDIINLFSQATGSGRNMGIVVSKANFNGSGKLRKDVNTMFDD
jgi:hypothetical protein